LGANGLSILVGEGASDALGGFVSFSVGFAFFGILVLNLANVFGFVDKEDAVEIEIF